MNHRCAGVLFCLTLTLSGNLAAQSHEHAHAAGLQHSTLLTIDRVLAMEQNRAAFRDEQARSEAGLSGTGDFTFELLMTSRNLPKQVHELNPFARKHTCLDSAHGGFAHDPRRGKGEVYWFLQGAGMLRVNRDRSSVDLLKTDPRMVKFNMHNATFFVHKGQARIAWPANEAGMVFITDVNGRLLHSIGRPTIAPYLKGARYMPTDTAYLDGQLWITDGYGSKYVMSYDLDRQDWTDTIFGGVSQKAEPGKFGTNHGITIHEGLLYVSGRFFARIHSYRPDTRFVSMFPLPEGSKPCDFEFFLLNNKLYGVAASLNTADANKKTDHGAAIYVVEMKTLKIIATIKPKDELGLQKFTHIHNVLATIDDGRVTLFCQAWNGGDFAVLRQKKAR